MGDCPHCKLSPPSAMPGAKHPGLAAQVVYHGPKKGGKHWSSFYRSRPKKAEPEYDEDGNPIEKHYDPEKHAELHEQAQRGIGRYFCCLLPAKAVERFASPRSTPRNRSGSNKQTKGIQGNLGLGQGLMDDDAIGTEEDYRDLEDYRDSREPDKPLL